MSKAAMFTSMQTAGASPTRGGVGQSSPGKQGAVKKLPVHYQKYLDKMSEALNKNMEKNIFPHWRNHQSMKGNVQLFY